MCHIVEVFGIKGLELIGEIFREPESMVGIYIDADADTMEILAQQIAAMTIVGRLFSHHALVEPQDHVPVIAICQDRAAFSDILSHGLPLHTLVAYACSQVWFIGTLVHQSTPASHHEIMLACAILQLWLPCQWRKTIRGAVLVNLLEQVLCELLFFCCSSRLSIAGCRRGIPRAAAKPRQSCTCRE